MFFLQVMCFMALREGESRAACRSRSKDLVVVHCRETSLLGMITRRARPLGRAVSLQQAWDVCVAVGEVLTASRHQLLFTRFEHQKFTMPTSRPV